MSNIDSLLMNVLYDTDFSEEGDCAVIKHRVNDKDMLGFDTLTGQRLRNDKPFTEEDDSWFDSLHKSGNKAAKIHAMHVDDYYDKKSTEEFDKLV